MATVAVASAPGRCGLLGNPSDIYGGRVLSCSVPVRNRVRLTVGEDGPPDDPRLWDAARQRIPIDSPIRVEWETGVPRSSGLSGSTAMLMATVVALRALRNDAEITSVELAELTRDIERHGAEIVCGYQDAYMVAMGGVQLMDFAGKHPVTPGPWAKVMPLRTELPFLCVTTGVERLSGGVHGPMAERWLAGEALVQTHIQAISQLAEPGMACLVSGDWAGMAELMTENQRRVAELGGSGDAIDALIARCRYHGARSAKLAGAGLGGTVVALTDDPKGLQSRLTTDGYTKFIHPNAGIGARLEDIQ